MSKIRGLCLLGPGSCQQCGKGGGSSLRIRFVPLSVDKNPDLCPAGSASRFLSRLQMPLLSLKLVVYLIKTTFYDTCSSPPRHLMPH